MHHRRLISSSIAGLFIYETVGKRCFTLLKHVGLKPRLTVTGGCAKNQGLLMELKRLFQIDIAPLTVDPQLIGALGAAILASRKG